MRYTIAERFPHPIIDKSTGPLVSIFMPTSRLSTETRNNIVRYKNLLKTVETKLGTEYPGKDAETLLATLRELTEDKIFWNYQLDGLGILASPEETVIYKLQRDIPEFVEVSGTFHIKPLLSAYQGDDSYQILALNKNEFRLFEGNRDAIREVVLPPEERKTLKDVVGTFYEEAGSNAVSLGSSGKVMFGGVGGSTRDEEAVDQEKFFRYVDRYIYESHSKRTELPLILASLPEHQKDFAKISHNEFLQKDGIKKDPQSLDPDALRTLAWEILEPQFYATIDKLAERYDLSKSRELASEDISEVARAALENRVDTLLVNLDKTIPGRIEPGNDRLLVENGAGDMLNDLAVLALKQKAKVFVVPKEKMDLETGVKSIFRYL
ncbi:hypothetical protein KCG48_09200 [Proteiniclasticum sp. BAD-10]|uniref:Uncharacterized protein n=1 Tax=Proteiniclasticum sediminis TaxID=2804028 RepID=A0A941CSE9_9CLOT|nr:hypothetical protein [Proteiniclasticum sediminis]MBR0576516.1 hypothetical protein [Proteiniclasticum sediminis]